MTHLPTELGVTLMMRTTRTLKLMELGAAFLRKAETAINTLRIAQEEASESQSTPTGTLGITAPANTVSHVIMKAVIGVTTRNRK
jgi:LysR family transcriptional regulator, transcriptional activator for aaeXAB operon